MCDSNTEHWGILPLDSVFWYFPSYEQRGAGGGAGGADGQCYTHMSTVPGFPAPSQTSILQNRVYKSIQLFWDWERRIKANFFLFQKKDIISSMQRVWQKFENVKICYFLPFFTKKGQNYWTSKWAGPAVFSPIFLWSMPTEPPLSPVSRFAFENIWKSPIVICYNFQHVHFFSKISLS